MAVIVTFLVMLMLLGSEWRALWRSLGLLQ
jgi:hypothetical protein